jgi:hypothetical protein
MGIIVGDGFVCGFIRLQRTESFSLSFTNDIDPDLK